MAETTLDLRDLPKPTAYETLYGHIVHALDGVDDEIAAMATISALIHHGFGFLWTGFYRVVVPEHLLRVGPYQGSLGCLEITFGKGVCGTVAASGEAIVVDDVGRFPGHIACDIRARSEIVVPVRDSQRTLRAVLDIDAETVGAFDLEDVHGLTRIVNWFAAPRSVPDGPLG